MNEKNKFSDFSVSDTFAVPVYNFMPGPRITNSLRLKSKFQISIIIQIVHRKLSTFHVLSPFHGGGIAYMYLKDPDIYSGWSFYTPGRASQVRQVEG